MSEVSTCEGWREYVNASHDRPLLISREELSAMSFGERAFYNDARARYSQAGAFVKTPLYREFQRAVRERIYLNQYRGVGKLGLILSGEPGQGKTTTLLEIGKEHELRRRRTMHQSAADGMYPVIYVAVPAQCSAKALLHEFARFFALPVLGRMKYGDLLEMVANAMQRCSTELVLVDDVHHLDLRYRLNIEASDMLKQLSERCGGTFVYAGIAVENTGLLSGTREGQIRKRFQVHTAGSFKISTKQGQADWGDLLLAIEESLCLLRHRPRAILSAAIALHRLTNGEIGLLKDLLQVAALRAIEDDSEELDVAEFEREVARLQNRAQSALS